MNDTLPIGENIYDYDKIILELENLKIKLEEEDKTIILLYSFSKSFSTFVVTMKYARYFIIR